MPKDMEGLRSVGVTSPPPKGWRGTLKAFDNRATTGGEGLSSQQKYTIILGGLWRAKQKADLPAPRPGIPVLKAVLEAPPTGMFIIQGLNEHLETETNKGSLFQRAQE